MARLADGDRSAMAPLVAELWPVLLAFARRGLPADPYAAEDVAQEVFLRICSRISELDRSRDALSWAFGIATFEILTQRRRRQRRRESFADTAALPELADAAGSVEDTALRAELSAALTEALGQLSAQDVARLGLEESARSAPATPAMRKQRQRALERLRVVWRRLYGEP